MYNLKVMGEWLIQPNQKKDIITFLVNPKDDSEKGLKEQIKQNSDVQKLRNLNVDFLLMIRKLSR